MKISISTTPASLCSLSDTSLGATLSSRALIKFCMTTFKFHDGLTLKTPKSDAGFVGRTYPATGVDFRSIRKLYDFAREGGWGIEFYDMSRGTSAIKVVAPEYDFQTKTYDTSKSDILSISVSELIPIVHLTSVS